MDLPTIEEIKKSFPGRIPDGITSIVIIESKPEPDALYKENSMIEWIGYFKGLAVGIKKFLFGTSGWAQIVVTSIGLFGAFTSDTAKGTWRDFENYSSAQVSYAEDLASRYITFGDPPESPPEQPEPPFDYSSLFAQPIATVPVSGHYVPPNQSRV